MMCELNLIRSLYQSQIEKADELSLLDQQMIASDGIYLNELIEGCVWKETLMSPEKTIDNWKHLLIVNLINYFFGTHDSQLAALIRTFESNPWNQSSQFFRLLVAFNHLLAKMPVPEVGVHLLESGAALIDFQEYHPWQALPYHPFHLEFGIFLSALGLFSKRLDIQNDVKRLAAWQLNTFDLRGYPIPSLFVREKEANYFELLLLNYLLFRAAACLTVDGKWASFAQVLGSHVKKVFDLQRPAINPLWVLMERLFDQSEDSKNRRFFIGEPIDFALPRQIYDTSTALVGFRTEQNCVVCTLHGGHTGLGYLRQKDVEIVNYGPQYYPLDDCRGFGIEGNHLSDHGIRQPIMEWIREGHFVLKGCVRLVDQPAAKPAQMDQFRGIWLEIVQEYKHSFLRIKTSFLGLEGWDSTGFSFFVKADRCRIGHHTTLLPGKLDRYDGDIMPIRLEGSQAALELVAHSRKGSMQIIPLCGGDNFWGANFLVAYLLDSKHRNYGWTVEKV